LKFALKLFTVAVDGRQVIVGQLAPLLFNFAFELLPIPFHTIPVHECFLSLRLLRISNVGLRGKVANSVGFIPLTRARAELPPE
jgi:hypothetical protein